MRAIMWIVVMAVILTAFLPVFNGAYGESERTLGAAATLRINSNAELESLAQSENWTGNGTASAPYVISGYDINAQGASAGLYVGNTTLYLDIENSHFYNATYGIQLYRVQNVAVLDNNLSYNSQAGIYIDESTNNTFYGNVMYGDGILISGPKTTYVTQKIADNNTVNGKSVYYYHNSSGVTVPSSAGEVIIANSTGMTVAGLDVSGSTVGVVVAYSSNITLEQGTIKSMIRNGVYLLQSSEIYVYSMSLLNNSQNGIYAEAITGSVFTDNNCSLNENAGIMLYNSNWNEFRDNTYLNNTDGLHFSGSGNNTVYADYSAGNSNDGILVYYSPYITVINSSMAYNWRGVEVISSLHTALYGNTLKYDGIFLKGAESVFTSQTIPANNTVNSKPVMYLAAQDLGGASVGAGAGEVILGGVTNAKISGENFTNSAIAVEIGYSSQITIENNSFNNARYSVYFWGANNVFLYNNSFSYSVYAVYAHNVSYLRTFGNLMYHPLYGYYFEYSQYNLIQSDKISYAAVGITLGYNSNWNVIERETVLHSNLSAMFVMGGTHNIVRNNVMEYSDNYAIWIFSGMYNVFYNNTFEFNRGSNGTYNASRVQVDDSDMYNLWNITGYGNYWYDWANNNNSNDQNNDGIVDWPYVIANEGTYVSADYKPLKVPSNATVFVPSSPVDLSARSGTDYVLLRWHAPIDDGGSPVKVYRVYRNGQLIATVPASLLYYNDTTVTGGQTYSYYVVAANSAGGWFESNSVQATPGGEVPEFSEYTLVLMVLVVVALVYVRRRTP